MSGTDERGELANKLLLLMGGERFYNWDSCSPRFEDHDAQISRLKSKINLEQQSIERGNSIKELQRRIVVARGIATKLKTEWKSMQSIDKSIDDLLLVLGVHYD